MIDTYIPACMLKNDVSNVGTFKQVAAWQNPTNWNK